MHLSHKHTTFFYTEIAVVNLNMVDLCVSREVIWRSPDRATLWFTTASLIMLFPHPAHTLDFCQAHFDKIPFSLYLSIRLLLFIFFIFLYYILWALFVHFLPFMYCFSSTILVPHTCPSVIVLVLLYLFSTQINSDHLIFFNVVPKKQPVAEVPKGSVNSELP